MIRGFYNSVSGLITLQNEQETITNNIANINNNGYKKRLLTKQSFDDVMISNRQKLNGDKYVRNNIGTMNLGVKTSDVETIFTQGSFKSTDKKTDFAIDGRGFFTVKRGNQTLFTRDGNFKIDQQGYLITNNGDRVLGRNLVTGNQEDIFIGDKEFSLDGENRLQFQDGTVTHQLLTADFSNEDYDKLEKVGNNYYTGGTPIYDARVEVRQNMLESSNIDSAEQIVKLMEIKRQFETNQKFVKMQDDTLEKAANQIGRV